METRNRIRTLKEDLQDMGLYEEIHLNAYRPGFFKDRVENMDFYLFNIGSLESKLRKAKENGTEIKARDYVIDDERMRSLFPVVAKDLTIDSFDGLPFEEKLIVLDRMVDLLNRENKRLHAEFALNALKVVVKIKKSQEIFKDLMKEGMIHFKGDGDIRNLQVILSEMDLWDEVKAGLPIIFSMQTYTRNDTLPHTSMVITETRAKGVLEIGENKWPFSGIFLDQSIHNFKELN